MRRKLKYGVSGSLKITFFIELYEKQSFADEVVSYLEKNDFKLIGVFNTSYDLDGNSVQSDFLFKKGPK